MANFTSAIAGRIRGTPYEQFMHRYGERTLAFLDSLHSEIEKGRINLVDPRKASVAKTNIESKPGSSPPWLRRGGTASVTGWFACSRGLMRGN